MPTFFTSTGDAYGRGAIRRDAVADVDHPGNVAATLGTVFTVVGLAVMGAGFAQVSSCAGEDFCGFAHAFVTIPGATIAALGVGPMIYGYVVWGGSVVRADHHGRPNPFGPPLAGGGQPTSGPTQLTIRF